MMTKTITFTGTNKKLSVCTGIHINKLSFVVDIRFFFTLSIPACGCARGFYIYTIILLILPKMTL